MTAHSLESTFALARWLRKHGVTVPQFAALLSIREKSPSTMTEIARAAKVSTAAATAIVDKLESMKWVRREAKPGDRRTTNVVMIDAGAASLNEIVS